MRVRCIKTRNEGQKDGWLTVGKEYVVLEVDGGSGSISFRMIADDGHTPALHESDLFEIVSPTIPPDWIFQTYPESGWVIRPAAFGEAGFWNAYFDLDEAAEDTFRRVLEMLQREQQ